MDLEGHVGVYDTTGFNMEGFAPQQGGEGAAPLFASHRGPVRLDSLPRVYSMGSGAAPAPEAGEVRAPAPAAPAAAPQAPAASDPAAIVALIGQLGELKEKGILTEEEFATKKKELLNRL